MIRKTICLFIVFIFFTATVSAAPLYSLTKCYPGFNYCSPYTERLSYGGNTVNYTVLPTKDPYTFTFKDTSKTTNQNLVHWDLGDGTCIKSPVTENKTVLNKYKTVTHKFKKIGHYTGCLQIDCKNMSGTLWVHKDLRFNLCAKPCKCGRCH